MVQVGVIVPVVVVVEKRIRVKREGIKRKVFLYIRKK